MGRNPNRLFEGSIPVKEVSVPKGQKTFVLQLSLVINYIFHLALASWPHKTTSSWDFPGSPVAKTPALPLQGARVQSLVGELRSSMPRRTAKNEIHIYIN